MTAHPHHPDQFTGDYLPLSFGPWEAYAEGPFATPELAAAAVVKQAEADEKKAVADAAEWTAADAAHARDYR